MRWWLSGLVVGLLGTLLFSSSGCGRYPLQNPAANGSGNPTPSATATLPPGNAGVRRSITIDPNAVAGNVDLTDYPLMVELAAVGPGFWFESDGVLMDFEIDTYDAASGALLAWVRVPRLSVSMPTVLSVNYGDPAVQAPLESPTAVWNGFTAVWHMSEDPSASDILDSTVNALDALPENGMDSTSDGPGNVGRSLYFRGEREDYLVVPYDSMLGIRDDITIAAWVAREFLDYSSVIAKTDGANVWDYDLYFGNFTQDDGFPGGPPGGGGDPDRPAFWSDETNPQETGGDMDVVDGEWHFVVVTRANGQMRFYVNGFETGGRSVSGRFSDNPVPVRIGTDGPMWSSDSMFEGLIDEIWLTESAWTAAQVETHTVNMGLPELFYRVGPEENRASP